MTKYLNAYRAAPTIKNARRVRDYANAHPMSRCLLDSDDCNFLDGVLEHATRGY